MQQTMTPMSGRPGTIFAQLNGMQFSAWDLDVRIPETVMPTRAAKAQPLTPSERDELMPATTQISLAVVREAADRARGTRKQRRWTDQASVAEIDAALDGLSLQALRGQRRSKKTGRLIGLSVEDALLQMRREAVELEAQFHRFDDAESRVGADDDKDLDDAIFAARVDARYESASPKSERVIGAKALDREAKAHRLIEWLVVHDRRAVIVKRPTLVPSEEYVARTTTRRTPWGTEESETTYTPTWELQEPTTSKRFYSTELEAQQAVDRIVTALKERGPVRVYRPDALADDAKLSDAVRRHRAERRAWRARHQRVTLPNGRTLTTRRKSHLDVLTAA